MASASGTFFFVFFFFFCIDTAAAAPTIFTRLWVSLRPGLNKLTLSELIDGRGNGIFTAEKKMFLKEIDTFRPNLKGLPRAEECACVCGVLSRDDSRRQSWQIFGGRESVLRRYEWVSFNSTSKAHFAGSNSIRPLPPAICVIRNTLPPPIFPSPCSML